MQHERKDPTIARFHYVAKENAAKSREAGRPVFDNVEMVEIVIPGDSRTKLVRAVTDNDRARWPDLYARFRSAGVTPPPDGMPLEQWPQIDAAQAAELKMHNVHTVEQLADVADHLLARLGMGARALQLKARQWLALGSDQGRAVEKLLQQDKELAAAKAENATLAQQVRDLAGIVAKMQAQMNGGEMPESFAPLDPEDDVLSGVDMNEVAPAGPRRGRRAA